MLNNISQIITITGLLIILSLVAAKDIKNRINQAFILFGSVLILYDLCSFVGNFLGSYNNVLTCTRTTLMLANFIPIAFYIFTLTFIGRKKLFGPIFYMLTAIAVILIPISYMKNSIGAINVTTSGVNLSKTGPLLWLTIINFAIATTISFSLLLNYKKHSDLATKSQINIIVLVTGLVIIINLISQIVLPEFHHRDYGNIIGNPSLILFVGGIAYTILKHKLFDIRSAAFRSVSFVITLLALITVISVLLLLPLSLLFPGTNLDSPRNFYAIGASIILAFLFNPIIAIVQKITDKLFFKVNYDSEQLVNDVSRILASEIRLDQMSKQTSAIICKTMGVSAVDIIVLDKSKIYYESAEFFKLILGQLEKDLETIMDDTVVTENLNPGPLKSALQGYKIDVVALLKVQNDKVGYMLFSNRLRALPYLNKDILAIDTISDELAIAIKNSQAFDQIRLFNANLQKKVAESTNQLLLANNDLKAAGATKDDFISMVSHQLGTPLTVMEGFLSLIIQGFYKEEDKKDEALKKALSRTRVMKNLVFDLLNMSRMSAGKFFLELSAVNLDEVVKDEVSQLEIEAKDKNVTLTYHPPSNPIPTIQLDEPKTRQAIMNLVNNAIFYSPDGKVDVYLTSDQTNILFRVIDTGIGVPENQKTKLFTKFFRADNAVRESPNGTGIGLYLVKRVVEDQHGSIIFSSEVGKGSTFGFSIPIVEKLA